MDRSELRRRQKPFKERYRTSPDDATIILHAEGSLAADSVSCSVQTGRALVAAGLHPSTGGDPTLACSGDMLLQALVACAGVTLRAVATNRGIEVTGTVSASGELDVRGTLGVDPDAPVGFRAIELRFDLSSDASDDELDALVTATHDHCVVLQTLKVPPEIVVSR